MKSAYYAAVVTNCYRMAIDAYLADPENYVFNTDILGELDSVSHREYATGFYLDKPFDNAQLSSMTGYIREKSYFATAVEYTDDMLSVFGDKGVEIENENGRLYRFMQKNKVKVGDGAEIISPSKIGRGLTVNEIYLDSGDVAESAPHPYMTFWVRVPFEVKVGDIMRAAN